MAELRSSLRSPLRAPIYSPTAGKWVALTGTIADFPYNIDFVAGTTKGGTQPYGSNSSTDGRFFTDAGNSLATFCPPNSDGSGTLVSVSASGLRRTTGGHWSYQTARNNCLQNRDLTQATNWTATNVTVAKNQVGANGAANAASLITATANGGTILQSLTSTINDRILSVDVHRVSGTGTFEMTIDNVAFAAVSGLDGTFRQKFITQLQVTNPVFGFRLGTAGDSFAVDFVTQQTPAASGLLVPSQYRVAQTTTTAIVGQSRATAQITDSGPLTQVPVAPYAFFWQGRSERSSGAGIITGITDTFVTGSTAGVAFAQGGGTATTAANAWKVGLDQVNKVAGYCTSTSIKVACNGVVSTLATGVTFPASLDHWDFATNGAGSRSLEGVSEFFAIGNGLTFTDAQLIAMTS